MPRNENLNALTKEHLARKFLANVQKIAYLFAQMRTMVMPLSNQIIGWQNVGENYMSEDDKLSVSEKRDTIVAYVNEMNKITQTYAKAKSTNALDKRGVYNVIHSEKGVAYYVKFINGEVAEEKWFDSVKTGKPDEYSKMKECYDLFMEKVKGFYLAVEKDNVSHPSLVNYKETELLPKYEAEKEATKRESSRAIDKLLQEGVINVGSAKLAALNEDYRNGMFDGLLEKFKDEHH